MLFKKPKKKKNDPTKKVTPFLQRSSTTETEWTRRDSYISNLFGVLPLNIMSKSKWHGRSAEEEDNAF